MIDMYENYDEYCFYMETLWGEYDPEVDRSYPADEADLVDSSVEPADLSFLFDDEDVPF